MFHSRARIIHVKWDGALVGNERKEEGMRLGWRDDVTLPVGGDDDMAQGVGAVDGCASGGQALERFKAGVAVGVGADRDDGGLG